MGLALSMFPMAQTAALGHPLKDRRTKYSRVVVGGYDIARIADVCLVFEGSISAGDFFDGLEKTETAGRSIFRKNSQLVDHFPEELVFDLKVTVVRCDQNATMTSANVIIPQLVKSLAVKPQWKAGLDLLPAEIVYQDISDVARLESGRAVQHHRLGIRSESIPLTNHLVVVVLSSEGERISRVSVGL